MLLLIHWVLLLTLHLKLIEFSTLYNCEMSLKMKSEMCVGVLIGIIFNRLENLLVCHYKSLVIIAVCNIILQCCNAVLLLFKEE